MSSFWKRIAAMTAICLIGAACAGSNGDESSSAGDESSAATTDGSDSAEGDESETSEPTRAEKLVLATIAQPASLQANQAQVGNSSAYYQALFDGLLRAEGDGVAVSPHLATEWSYDESQLVLTMTLRDDVTFSDGTAFDADVAVSNLLRFRDSNGPEAGTLSVMADVVALDSTTLEITLTTPDPAFLNSLALSGGFMQSPANFDAPDADSNPIGSGPYVLDSSKTVIDSEYVFLARENYWAPETVHFDEFVLRIISDNTATVNAILADEVDAANLLSDDVADQIEAAGWNVSTQELNWAGFTLIDRDGSLGTPLGDVRVRQAINMALDREAIILTAVDGYGTPTDQVFPPDSPGYDAALEELYAYDVEGARALMAEAGYADGFTLSMPMAGLLGEELFAVLGDQLAQIGIEAEWVESAPGGYIGELLSGEWPAYYMILSQSPSPWQFSTSLISPSAVWNPRGYSDETTASLFEEIPTLPRGDEQDALIAELGRHVTEEAWFAPILRDIASFASDSDLDVTLQAGNVLPNLWNIVPAS